LDQIDDRKPIIVTAAGGDQSTVEQPGPGLL
jgi:hypothetical protein